MVSCIRSLATLAKPISSLLLLRPTFLRPLHTTRPPLHGGGPPSSSSAAPVTIHYILKDGSKRTITAQEGDNVMHLAHRHGIEIEGACEASLACCTCHVYVDEVSYDRLGTELCEEEEDMLDMAPDLRENSRLSCQIVLSREVDGITVELPRVTRNFYVDGHVPQPH